MLNNTLKFALLLFFIPLTLFGAERPNVVVIIVDDMGFSDVGCYGGEIETPNLDTLAAGGIRFTQFYNTARCWPTRSALMTGFYPQQIRMDPYQGGDRLPNGIPLLPHHLKQNGYRCYHSGKWHVNGAPLILADGGFDRSYHLTDYDRNFYPKKHHIDDKPLEAVDPNAGYYSTCAITDYTLEQLDEHQREHAEQPFFVYTAYTVPHFPLQALPQDIAKYQARYSVGWDVIRAERLARLQQFGIVQCDLSPREETCGPPYRQPSILEILGEGEVLFPVAWDTLTEEQQRFQAMKMAIHAAMVDRVDQEVGRILGKIREMGQWDNTILFFLADNGASAEITVRGDGHDKSAPPGSAATFLSLGPGWSTASNTPFRRHKIWNHEGGVSTPLIVHWPNGIKRRGRLNETQGHVVDLVPTILSLTDTKPLAEYHEEAVPGFPGVDLSAAISETENITLERGAIYFEHEGNAALRRGDWKCVYTRTGEPKERVGAANSEGTTGWALYNMKLDRGEQNDLAETEPERLAEMVSQWRELNRTFREQER